VYPKFPHIVGLKFQSPPPCPANYIPRSEIINEITKVLLRSHDSSTINIETTVTIRGIGGIGKSTIAKALCYHPLIKMYFTNGFLWISLSPPRPSPEAILREIYGELTDKSTTCSFSLLKNRIRSVVSSDSCKLLIILDDAIDAEDITPFMEAFSNCKSIVTTRKKDINITIPSKKCFDIGPMKINEAVQLLTWQIPQLATLNDVDANKIEELAKDLYYWPLLLNLVHGQLYMHCTEWKESPKIVISNVQKKLQDSGLTAFDPRNIKKENAVKACINASLELLSENEKNVLFHIVSSAGIGSYVIKAAIFNLSKVSSEEFDKQIKNLWCHGLVSFGNVTLPSLTVNIPGIEVHEIIAQYIIEEMPYSYQLFLNKIDTSISTESLDFIELGSESANVDVRAFIVFIDVLAIPFVIRCLAVFTRADQVIFFNILDLLIESYNDILNTRAVIKFFRKKEPLSLKGIYGSIKYDCKVMQSLLADSRYDDAKKWITEYIDNHPYKVLMDTIETLINELTDECKQNPKLVAFINEKLEKSPLVFTEIQSYNTWLLGMVDLHKIILEMIEAGNTSEEIMEVFSSFFDAL